MSPSEPPETAGTMNINVKNTAIPFPNKSNHSTSPSQILSVLSWNIHDGMDSSYGPKTADNDFVDVLKGCSIFCFQETKTAINIPNYRCFNKPRPDSRSGGLCIGVQRSLGNMAKEIETECEDIMAITLRCKSGKESNNITIINVYDSQEESSFKSRRKQKMWIQHSTLDSLFDLLQGKSSTRSYLWAISMPEQKIRTTSW